MRRTPEPVEIARQDAGHLRILWDDGHVSVYRFARLRSACPCAGCGSRPRTPPGLMLAGAATPRAIETVGNYAIHIEWSDGHSTGIYSHEWLRRACECEACRSGGPTRERR